MSDNLLKIEDGIYIGIIYYEYIYYIKEQSPGYFLFGENINNTFKSLGIVETNSFVNFNSTGNHEDFLIPKFQFFVPSRGTPGPGYYYTVFGNEKIKYGYVSINSDCVNMGTFSKQCIKDPRGKFLNSLKFITIFKDNYKYFKYISDIHREELIKKVYHPKRVFKLLEMGYDIGEDVYIEEKSLSS